MDPDSYGVETLDDRLRHALAWTLAAYKSSLRGQPTPGLHVISFAETTLKEAANG